MSDADRAYELAQREIAKAKRTGATGLSLFGEALERLSHDILQDSNFRDQPC